MFFLSYDQVMLCIISAPRLAYYLCNRNIHIVISIMRINGIISDFCASVFLNSLLFIYIYIYTHSSRVAKNVVNSFSAEHTKFLDACTSSPLSRVTTRCVIFRFNQFAFYENDEKLILIVILSS